MKLVIGFITYNQATAKYLPDFLPSLLAASNFLDEEVEIFAIDNSEEADNENSRLLKKDFPQIKLQQGGRNLGFAAANNKMIEQAREHSAEFYLTLNPDMLLEKDSLNLMLSVIEADSRCGSVSPKLRRWDFSNNKNKTKIIDSCGLILKSGFKFIDLGQGELDQGQYDQASILGASGAAALYRVSALAEVKDEHGYFDERFFMYKEDCDLAYRLFAAGWNAALAPQAIIHHDRSAAAARNSILGGLTGRSRKSSASRRWSWDSQQLLITKHWREQSWPSKLAIAWRQALAYGYAVIFEKDLLAVSSPRRRGSHE